jgi:capsular polysaccharide biosynthesis protein
MDAGRAAASKTSPRRKVMVIATFLISLVSGVAYVFVAHRYAEDLKDVVSRMRVDLSRR